MLTVLRITPHFFRPGKLPVAFDPVGGLQNQTWALAQGIDEAGARQTVLTTYIPGSARRARLSKALHVECRGPWLPEALADPLLCFGWFLGSIPEILRARRRYDVVHIHFNHSVWCRVMAVGLRWLKVPLVVSMNTALWGGLQEALSLKGKRYDITRWIERAALASADRVIALTEGAAKSAAREMGLDARKLTVIPDAVDAAVFRNAVEGATLDAFRKRHGIPPGRPIISYIGRISNEKGWRDLPALAAALAKRNAFLLICGDGPERSKAEAALTATSLSDQYWTVTGFLSPADVRTALGLTDVLVLPSRREALGSVLLEAMAAGVPAVAYAVGGIVEVAGSPEAISLVPAARRESFVDRVLTLLASEADRQELVERGRRRVNDFSIEKSVARSLDLYAAVIAARARTRQPREMAFQEDGSSPDGA